MIILYFGNPSTNPLVVVAHSFSELRAELVEIAQAHHPLSDAALPGWEGWLFQGADYWLFESDGSDRDTLFPLPMTVPRVKQFAADISGLSVPDIYIVEDNPDLASSCGQLMVVRDGLGLSDQEFADSLEVDVEVVEAWLSGSVTIPLLLTHTLNDLLTQQDEALAHFREWAEMGDPDFFVEYPAPGDSRPPILPAEWEGRPLGWVRSTLQRAVLAFGVPVHRVGEERPAEPLSPFSAIDHEEVAEF